MEDKIRLDSIEDALADFREGKFVVVVDDEDRENEGDLIIAAEKITPEDVNFMLKNARGVLCVPMTMARCKELNLEPQVQDNTSVLGLICSADPDTFIRYMPRMPVCFVVRGIPRRLSTSHALRD